MTSHSTSTQESAEKTESTSAAPASTPKQKKGSNSSNDTGDRKVAISFAADLLCANIEGSKGTTVRSEKDALYPLVKNMRLPVAILFLPGAKLNADGQLIVED